MKKFVVLLILLNASLVADTTISTDHPHAWGANTGWIHARPSMTDGAIIGLYYCTGYLWSANAGWVSLGSGTPVNGWSYANNSSTDWGVNHDGEGNLSGHAYSANMGWITFEQTHGQPRVDLASGDLHGSVWSANAGWINLNTVEAKVVTQSLATGPDSDSDGLPDAWEFQQIGLLSKFETGHDYDSDGSPDEAEFAAGTSPTDENDFLTITAYTTEGLDHLLTWRNTPTRAYMLETGTDLTDVNTWTEALLSFLPPESGTTRSHQVDDIGGTPRFWRVVPKLPLSVPVP